MARKDVTPNNKNNRNNGTNSNDLLKKLSIGIAGGVLGGLLTIGGFYVVNRSNVSYEPQATAQSSTNNQGTKVSNIKYNVESDTTKAVDKVQGAVVSVLNLQRPSSNPNESDPFGGMFGGQGEQSDNVTDKSAELQTASEGSGVIYKKDDKYAYIVTNNHVVSKAEAVEVLLNDGTKVDAKVMGTDTYSDLAVLRIAADKVKDVAEFGDSDALKIGEPAIAIGSPLGSSYANTVTQGIVSAKNRRINNSSEDGATSINAIQTDAAINPGNSGGPLINAAGQIIGINSIKVAGSGNDVSVEGMGFAIPSNDVVKIISELEVEKKVSRPMLGVTMYDLSSISSAQQEKILKVPEEVKNGIILNSIQPASPAEQAGLKQYDVVVDIDGTEVKSGQDLQNVLYSKKVGDTINVTFYRGSEKKTVPVELTLDQSALEKQKNTNE